MADLKSHGVCSQPGNEVDAVTVVVIVLIQLQLKTRAWRTAFTVVGANACTRCVSHTLHARVQAHLNERVGYTEWLCGDNGIEILDIGGR